MNLAPSEAVDISIRALANDDRNYAMETVARYFGSDRVVSRGRLHQCDKLPGLIAVVDDRNVGLLQYDVRGADLEVVTLVSELNGVGVGRCLLNRVASDAKAAGNIKRCWLITTNNNHNAINFYHHIGWTLKTIHKGAVNEARAIKSEIPLTDDRGIAIEDEWELELKL